jgi:hypothetical protein
MTEPRKLERGMLLLDPETYSTPHLWTVATTGPNSATLIAHYGACYADAKLKTGRVPDGWTLVEHNAAAEALTALSRSGPSEQVPLAAAPSSKNRPSETAPRGASSAAASTREEPSDGRH